MIRLLMREKTCGLLAKAVVVCLCTSILVAAPYIAIAQDAPEEPAPDAGPAAGEQETDDTGGAEGEPEAPGASPEQEPKRKNPFKRIGPQPITQEQREEAERLRK